jgi:Predicted transcriptional regulator, contains C-terminal CBS domains
MNSQAHEIMHKDLTAVTEKDRVEDALHALYNQRLTGLPVVKDDWVLVGFLSETDILQAAFPTTLNFWHRVPSSTVQRAVLWSDLLLSQTASWENS